MRSLLIALTVATSAVAFPAWAADVARIFGKWTDSIAQIELTPASSSIYFYGADGMLEPPETWPVVYEASPDPGDDGFLVIAPDGSGLLVIPVEGDTLKVVFPGVTATSMTRVRE